MNFEDFCMMTDILEEFDRFIDDYEALNESEIGDLDIGNVIMSNLDKINVPNAKKILGVISAIAKFSGKKARDIIKLFSKEGIDNVKTFIKDNILGSEEIKYITRKFDDNRYQGYKGLEQFVKDMKEENPTLYDSLLKAVHRIMT